jgi:hypothetical protein
LDSHGDIYVAEVANTYWPILFGAKPDPRAAFAAKTGARELIVRVSNSLSGLFPPASRNATAQTVSNTSSLTPQLAAKPALRPADGLFCLAQNEEPLARRARAARAAPTR